MPDRPSDPSDPRFHRPRECRDPDRRDRLGEPDERNEPNSPERHYDEAASYGGAGFDPRYGHWDDPRSDERDNRQRRSQGMPPSDAAFTPERSRTRLLVILVSLAALLLVAWLSYRMTRSGPGQDRLDDGQVGAAIAAPATADQRCASQQTYDLVKRELFRRAAQVRGSDAGAFDRLSAYAVVRIASPVFKRQDEELGILVCSGQIALDLPPGVSVVGGRRTLRSQSDYALQPAADRSGDVVTLSGADGILVPLATLAWVGDQPGLAAQEPTAVDPVVAPTSEVVPPRAAPAPPQDISEQAAPEPPVQEPAPNPEISARPSFNCVNARTRGEVAICRNPRLAALDRRMSAEFFGAVRQASPEQRALLQRTRGTFLAYRDRCASDACIAGAYNDRIREIRDIINGRWNPR